MKLAKIIDFLKSHIKINIYRVGDIILSTNNRNPGLDYGGTWELWGAGRVPVGIDLAQTEFNEVEKTGGEKKHTLTVDEMPAHNHEIAINNGSTDSTYFSYSTGAHKRYYNGQDIIKNTGGGQSHNNLQPYITCYMWKKTA